MKYIITLCLLIAVIANEGNAQVWQWRTEVDSVVSSETKTHPVAYLWIPEKCKQVRAVVFAQHNMIEEGILEHPTFRKTLSELDIAEVWVTPGINMPFDFNRDAGEDFDYMMKKLAVASGYSELENAPVIPLGHSAYATFPWNFAAWNPSRTLALISVHGDAPQTTLTGYGKGNVEWGNRNIDGVPALFIMGEYEWWEDRISPAFKYLAAHTPSVISLFCDAGHGHFDYSDELVSYMAIFIKKAAQKRLPRSGLQNGPATLRTIKPEDGWLMDRWHKDSLPAATATAYNLYKGDRRFASWVFDRDMADVTERLYAQQRGKQLQFIGFRQNGSILRPDKSHANYSLKFMPLDDGTSFQLNAFWADTSRVKEAERHASTALLIDRICGPVRKINDSIFQLCFNRIGFNNPKRSFDLWMLAHNEGDGNFKSAVQQLNIKFPALNKGGKQQVIFLDSIPNQKVGTKQYTIRARSSVGLPIGLYIRQGPAYIRTGELHFTQLPPKTKFPIAVTVVAWQYGIVGKVQTAEPVEVTFYLNK